MGATYLTPEELAARYQVPVKTIYAWRHKRTAPPAHRFGRHVRFELSAVERWEAEQRIGGAA